MNKKKISKKTKLTVYNTMYIPLITYGAGNWVLNKTQENGIQVAEMRYSRKVEGYKKIDKIRNAYIGEKLKIKPLINKIEQKSFRKVLSK